MESMHDCKASKVDGDDEDGAGGAQRIVGLEDSATTTLVSLEHAADPSRKKFGITCIVNWPSHEFSTSKSGSTVCRATSGKSSARRNAQSRRAYSRRS